MLSTHRWPSFSGIIIILIMVISVFSFVYSALLNMLKKIENFLAAFLTADNKIIFIPSDNSLTGNMVKVAKIGEITLKSNHHYLNR